LKLPTIPRIRIESIKAFAKSYFYDKRLIVLYFSTILYTGGMGMIKQFLPIIVSEQFGASVLQIGIILVIMSLVSVLISPFSGFLSDKFGRIKILVLGLALYSALGFISLFIRDLNGLVLVIAGLGLCQGLVHTNEMALMADLTPKDSWGTIQGIHGTFQDIGGVISPIISSAVWIVYGPMSIFPIAGIIQIVNLIAVLSISVKSSFKRSSSL